VIPVLGVPILAHPELLPRMFASVDVDIGETIVVDNGDLFGGSDPDVTIVRPGGNLGVAASWNHIIKIRPKAPWWAIASFDIEFGPGDLQRLTDHMETVGGLAMLGGFEAFGIDHDTVRRVGWFDENYVPAYFEDNDYDYRCRLAGVSLVSLPSGMRHQISSTIRGSDSYQRQNAVTFPLNHRYFIEKWGGPPYQERFTTPFDKGGDPRDCTLDIDRLVEQSWRPE
jgi:GT2 family glycosyltransferase